MEGYMTYSNPPTGIYMGCKISLPQPETTTRRASSLWCRPLLNFIKSSILACTIACFLLYIAFLPYYRLFLVILCICTTECLSQALLLGNPIECTKNLTHAYSYPFLRHFCPNGEGKVINT